MESYSKEFVGFYNNHEGYTPFLDSLMHHSMVFTNAYANGLKSIEALPAITASIPSLMTNPFITSDFARNKFQSLASLLNNEGYSTSFFHGGKRGTMGFYSFAHRAGFQEYYGLEEYSKNTVVYCFPLFLFVFCWFLKDVSMDFCKGRIPPDTLQIPLEAPKILSLSIFCLHPR